MDTLYYINDIRVKPDFKGVTFSGYKLGEVISTLIKSLTDTKIEETCYWSAELICAGHLKELWNCILTYYSKHINITNPRLAIYLDMRFSLFLQILKNDCMSSEMLMRNNSSIRAIFCEIMCVLCESTHGHVLTDIRITPQEFDCVLIKEKLKAPTVSYLDGVFLEDDPKELFIAVNELCFQLSPNNTGGIYSACYWVEWIMEYSKYCRLKHKKCICARRPHNSIDGIYQLESTWIIWDAIAFYSKKKENELLNKIIASLRNLYCIGYTGITLYSKRKYIIYCAITYLFFPESSNTVMIPEHVKRTVSSAISNIDKIYTQIKKNEQSPKTDYLFTNISKTKRLEESIQKMKLIHSINIPTVEISP